MMKTAGLFIIALFTCIFLTAQETNYKAEKKKKVYLGIKTGANFSHFRFKDLNDNKVSNISSNWRVGFVLGAFAKVPVYNSFSVQPEFLYSSLGDSYEDNAGNKTKARYNYFSVPLLFKLGFCKRFAVVAGPQFDFLIQGKEDINGEKYDVSIYIKDYDVLATGGIEFWPCKNFVLGARYVRSFIDVDERNAPVKFYHEGVQATIGLKFR